MHYPFLLYSRKADHQPLFKGLSGDPFIADLTENSPLLAGIDMRDQRQFQRILLAKMGTDHSWGVAAYLQIITEKGLELGYIAKGYCSEKDLPAMDAICPSPIPLFKVF